MTKAELEKIKNHIDNIPTIAPFYVPELIAGLEDVLSDVARYKEEAWAWCCVANERALERDEAQAEVERLKALLEKKP